MVRKLLALTTLGLLANAAAQAQPSNLITYEILPSQADPVISNFNDPNIVLVSPTSAGTEQLAIFLPGTGGKPANVALLLNTIAKQGYRVIGLEYNNEPAVVQVCPRNPDPKCSENFRMERAFGNAADSPVDNPPNESIESRLVTLLRYLDKAHPEQKWGAYLKDGKPAYDRLVLSGLSQGAGMAAYMAKKNNVARVVLFSSPWDFMAPSRELAPWIAEPGVTSPDRRYAEYHKRENTAALIAESYRALRIPPDHVLTFDLNLPKGHGSGENPFHGSTVRLEGYVPQWQMMYGRSPDAYWIFSPNISRPT